jgi:hypothetical protein
MARGRPPAWSIFRVKVIEVDDDGPVQMAKIEWPDEFVKQQAPILTLRHQMILAIIRRRYRNAIPDGIGIADLERLVESKWLAECKRRGVNYPAPKRDAIKRALDRAAH